MIIFGSMDLVALKIFITVATERSFSRAAAKLHKTQPAMSQAVRRLEQQLGEQLFDRSTKSPTLTDAGCLLVEQGARIFQCIDETESAIYDLRGLKRGRVLIGANEATVHAILPLVAAFRRQWPQIAVDVRRVQARQIGAEVHQGQLDIGVLTFKTGLPDLRFHSIGVDELVLLVPPSHEFAQRDRVTMKEISGQTLIAHNDPSPIRDRLLKLFEQRHLSLNMLLALPSLDAIKRAVEMGIGVAILPRRCAVTELARGHVVGVPVLGLSQRRSVLLTWRRSNRSHATAAFISMARADSDPAASRPGGAPPRK